MKRDDAIEELPSTYAVALRLHEAGATDDVIAVGLGTDPDSVPTILELAHRKLAELVARADAIPVQRSSS